MKSNVDEIVDGCVKTLVTYNLLTPYGIEVARLHIKTAVLRGILEGYNEGEEPPTKFNFNVTHIKE